MAAETDQIRAVIHAVVDEQNEQSPDRPAIEKTDEAVLFGQNGSMDSLGVVHFIVAVEQGIEEAFGVNVSLVSDKAMSPAQPFPLDRFAGRVYRRVAQREGIAAWLKIA